MNLNDYILQEFKKVPEVIKENMAEAGDTDIFEGSQWMGPHHHKYIIWDAQTRIPVIQVMFSLTTQIIRKVLLLFATISI